MQKPISSVERRLVYGCGFPPFRSVDGKTSVRHIFPEARSGIYVLAYKDGGYYVGLSIDVTKRFEQHVVSKRPIAAITFRTVHKARQYVTESETISILQDMGVKVANTEKMIPKDTGGTITKTLSSKDLDRWLNTDSWNDLAGKASAAPRSHSDIEERYGSKFLTRQDAGDILDFYADYVKKCIIKPFQTAPDKWNITCLPSTSYSFGKCLSMLNVGGQTAAYVADDRGEITVGMFVKKSV
ncbi:GIY-YIG nuclease family protein, partial [Candidatus Kaiserbacteria bacterium]|nr:GIY-YIG nuclease family protein [Candidatus Kaiserbacteria bacterium]